MGDFSFCGPGFPGISLRGSAVRLENLSFQNRIHGNQQASNQTVREISEITGNVDTVVGSIAAVNKLSGRHETVPKTSARSPWTCGRRTRTRLTPKLIYAISQRMSDRCGRCWRCAATAASGHANARSRAQLAEDQDSMVGKFKI